MNSKKSAATALARLYADGVIGVHTLSHQSSDARLRLTNSLSVNALLKLFFNFMFMFGTNLKCILRCWKSIPFILFLILPSCSNFYNSSIPAPSSSVKTSISTYPQLSIQTNSESLYNASFIAEGGYVVSFYERDEELRANVKSPLSGSLSKVYTDLPVTVARGINLVKLPRLAKESQKRMIHFRLPINGQLGRIYIIKSGLVGGMMEGDGWKGAQGLAHQPAQQLDDVEGLSQYFHAGYLEVTPNNYQHLLKIYNDTLYRALSHSYDGGILVKGNWKLSMDFEALLDVLDAFTKVKIFKVDCEIDDQEKWSEVIARAVQFYEELIELDLGRCQLEDKSLKDVIESINPSAKIQVLVINRTFLTEEYINELREGFTNLQLQETGGKHDSYSLLNFSLNTACQQLASDILTTTEAEADVRLNVYYRLKKALDEELKQDPVFRGEWNDLWKKLKEPELLVRQDLYYYPPENLDEQELVNGVFRYFEDVKIQVHRFNALLTEKFPQEIKWQKSLSKVSAFYDKYRKRVHQVWDDPRQFRAIVEPKALMMGEWWPDCYYRITQHRARYMLGLDEHANKAAHVLAKPNKSTSNHRVSCLPAGKNVEAKVYFKSDGQPSLNPSREYMLFSFYKGLGIEIPISGLLMLDHVKFNDSYCREPFILQASQAVLGQTGKAVLSSEKTFLLDSEHYAKQVLGVLLTGPVDGKADNFIVTTVENKLEDEGDSHGWVSIDNDEVFQPPIKSEEIHLKSILLLLAEMNKSLTPVARLSMSELSPSIFILNWLLSLQVQEFRYASFKSMVVAHGENVVPFRKEGTIMEEFDYTRKGGKLAARRVHELWEALGLPFTSFFTSIIPTISYLLSNIQKYLKVNENSELILSDLFNSCYPIVSNYYSLLQQRANFSPYQALKLLYDNEDEESNGMHKLEFTVATRQELAEEEYFKEDFFKREASESSIKLAMRQLFDIIHQKKFILDQQVLKEHIQQLDVMLLEELDLLSLQDGAEKEKENVVQTNTLFNVSNTLSYTPPPSSGYLQGYLYFLSRVC